jgi:RNA polymerase sigma factor (TIGR02999 family)
MAEPSPITSLLNAWSSGDSAALDELTRHVHGELHTLARTYLNRHRRNVTLQPTALINEAYVRLIGGSRPDHWHTRAQFFGIAARLMRNILVDYSRARRAAKRGADFVPVTLDETAVFSPDQHAPDILRVDDALSRLAEVDNRKAKVVELRYFGGMTRDEIASVSGLTLATVKRDLRLAEAWLQSYLTGQG